MNGANSQAVERPPRTASVRVSGVASGLMAGIGALFAASPFVMLLAIVPKFQEIFRDFGVELPALTRFILSVSDWLRTSPAGIAAAIVALVVICAAGIACARSVKWSGALLIAGVFILLGFAVIHVVALFTPMVKMNESLQQGGAV